MIAHISGERLEDAAVSPEPLFNVKELAHTLRCARCREAFWILRVEYLQKKFDAMEYRTGG